MFLYFQIFSHRKKLQRTNSQSHKLVPKIRRLCWQHTNLSHKLVPKIRRLCLQHTNSWTHAKNQAVVLTTHKLMKSQTRAKNQAVVFATHKLTNSCQKSGGCLCNTQTHEVTNSCQKTGGCVCNTRSHELVPKIRRLCLQHMNAQTHEHTILRKRCGTCVCCINTQSQELMIFPEKGCWVCLLQLTNSRKVKKIKSFMSSWLEAKMSLLFLYFQSVQVTNSQTRDCWLEFVSLCVHNPNRLSLNLFGKMVSFVEYW